MDVNLNISASVLNPSQQSVGPDPTGPVISRIGIHQSPFELLLSGAISGALAKSAVAPMDRLKILFQTNPHRSFSFRNLSLLSREIYGEAGIRAFWKGHTATLIRVTPYSATNFFVFDRTKRFFESYEILHSYPVLLRFASGAVSGSVAVIVTYPLETLRARLAVDLKSQYGSGYLKATTSIIRSEGLRSLYAGLRPTLIGIVPYAGSSFAIYETFRKDQTSFSSRILIGAVAGFAAQATTYPLDVVRRRMQVNPNEYRSIASTFVRVYRQEGLIHGLYKGLSMNAIKGPIAVAISLNANDHIKRYLADHSS